MNTKVLLALNALLFAILFSMYAFILIVKLGQAGRAKLQDAYERVICSALYELTRADCPDELFSKTVADFSEKMKNKIYKTVLETILLDYLEEPGSEQGKQALAVSYELGYPAQCLLQIQSSGNRNIALGSRKAGLYQYAEAIPDMLEALSAFSSDTQFQILMAISRIGDTDAMESAFNKIESYVMINERAVFEIIATFLGDKYELCKRMINCGNGYIATLFLKSLDGETAKALADDIIKFFDSENKEIRISAVKAIGKSGEPSLILSMLPMLNDSEWETRAITAKMIGMLIASGEQIDKSVGKALSGALGDRAWWVRQNAATAILALPEHHRIFSDAIKSGDAFAKDSIFYVLENAGRHDLLAELQQYYSATKQEETV